MDVLLIGGGGREAALAWKLDQSPSLGALWVSHDNPGFPGRARRLVDAALPAADPVACARAAAAAGVDLVVVGPEAPLAAGLADACGAEGVAAFGPSRAAARLESSKGYAKSFMERHGIPTAGGAAYSDEAAALAAVGAAGGPCVVKADGLAAGKGVFVCDTAQEARAAVSRLFAGAMGAAGARVVVEQRLEGPELSVLALCDGERLVTLPGARDHKRRFDGGRGPNTGGMGAFTPVPGAEALAARVEAEVLRPALAGMAAEGHPFVGCLYAGMMLTPAGPRVLEFNCRFGDPECQPLMRLLDEDLLPLLAACARGELIERPLRVRAGAAVCVVMVNGGYPGAYPKGAPIGGLESARGDVVVFQAGTRRQGDAVLATGGRVLGVTALGADLRAARGAAYAAAAGITWEGADLRSDIAEGA